MVNLYISVERSLGPSISSEEWPCRCFI